MNARILKSLKRSANYKKMFLANGNITPVAEAVLEDLLLFGGFTKDSASCEPCYLAMMEGRRQVVRRILNLIRVDEKKILQMEMKHGFEQ